MGTKRKSDGSSQAEELMQVSELAEALSRRGKKRAQVDALAQLVDIAADAPPRDAGEAKKSSKRARKASADEEAAARPMRSAAARSAAQTAAAGFLARELAELGAVAPEADAEREYRDWLRAQLDRLLAVVVEPLAASLSPNEHLRSLESAMDLVHAFSAAAGGLDRSLFMTVMRSMLSNEDLSGEAIQAFRQSFLRFTDVQFLVLKAVARFVKANAGADMSAGMIRGAYPFLYSLTVPASDEELVAGRWIAVADDGEAVTLKQHKKLFSDTWVAFLRLQLPLDVYKSVLVRLHDAVLPYMNEPRVLMDFLTESYEAGGLIAVLALNPLFVMITKFNLDVPSFYPKVYRQLRPSIFHVRYRDRFFRMLDLFLTSTHLPAYMAASFAKRLSRLALTAPPGGSMVAMAIIRNIMRRHQGIHGMAAGEGKKADAKNDPFDADTDDLDCTNAARSWLWEVATLRNHYLPAVSRMAHEFEKPIDAKTPSLNVESYVDMSYETLANAELVRKAKKAPALEFVPYTGLFGGDKDGRDDFAAWQISK